MRLGCAQQVLGGAGTQAANEARPDQVELLLQEFPAVGRFLGVGDTVIRRPAADDVADVDLGPRHAAGDDDPVEQLARFADERFAACVLCRSRRFADEADSGSRGPTPKTVCVRVAARCGQRRHCATQPARTRKLLGALSTVSVTTEGRPWKTGAFCKVTGGAWISGGGAGGGGGAGAGISSFAFAGNHSIPAVRRLSRCCRSCRFTSSGLVRSSSDIFLPSGSAVSLTLAVVAQAAITHDVRIPTINLPRLFQESRVSGAQGSTGQKCRAALPWVWCRCPVAPTLPPTLTAPSTALNALPPGGAGHLLARTFSLAIFLSAAGCFALRSRRAHSRSLDRTTGRGRPCHRHRGYRLALRAAARREFTITPPSLSTPTAPCSVCTARCTSRTIRSISRSITSRPATWVSASSTRVLPALACWSAGTSGFPKAPA